MPALQAARPQGNRQRQDEVADGQGNITFKGAEGQGIDGIGVGGEFRDADDVEQGGILDQRDELAGQRRQGLAQGLGKDNIPINLRPGQADGLGRFQLRPAHAFDARADDLRNVSPAETGQDHHALGHAVAVRHAQRRRHHIKQNHDLHQQRRAAHDFNIDPAKIVQRQHAAAPGQCQQQTENRAQHQRRRRNLDRAEPAVHEQFPIRPDRLPAPLVGQLMEREKKDQR